MKKVMKAFDVMLDLAISAACILLALKLAYTTDCEIGIGALPILLIAMKYCVEVFLTV